MYHICICICMVLCNPSNLHTLIVRWCFQQAPKSTLSPSRHCDIRPGPQAPKSFCHEFFHVHRLMLPRVDQVSQRIMTRRESTRTRFDRLHQTSGLGLQRVCGSSKIPQIPHQRPCITIPFISPLLSGALFLRRSRLAHCVIALNVERQLRWHRQRNPTVSMGT